MKTLITTFMLLFIIVAETRTQCVVSSGGSYTEFESYTISSTLGELATETVYFDDFILTQGFQQPWYTSAEKDSLSLVALYNSTNGNTWSNSLNWLTGPIDNWFGITIENRRVTQIALANNNLNGGLPTEIGDLTELQILNLQTNQISGQIPNEIGYLMNLVEMKLDNNQFIDTIPSGIYNNLNNLVTLTLDYNNFEIGSCSEFHFLISRGGWDYFAHSPQLNGFVFMDDCPIIFYDSPYFKKISDIPNDQGKQVQSVWYKSIHDENYSPDQFYSLWRLDEEFSENSIILKTIDEFGKVDISLDKKYQLLKDGEIWTYLNTIPAIQQNQYAYIAPTLMDSCESGINYSSFKVLFHNAFSYYQSPTDSGYSVDNLAPHVPENLNGTFGENQIELSWKHVSDKDLQYYAIYKSDDASSFLSEPYALTIDSSYVDHDLTLDTAFYKVSAFDFNGNESGLSNLIKLKKIFLNMKVYLEGSFNGTGMSIILNQAGLLPLSQPFNRFPWNYDGNESLLEIPNEDVVDWLLIELRDASDASSADNTTIISRQAALLLNDGFIVSTNGSSLLSFPKSIFHQLFVVIWHRNHLGILTANGVPEFDGVYTYDFSIDANQVFGSENGYKNLGGVWGMVAGDSSQDGLINDIDNSDWTDDAGNKGYLDADFNLDSEVNNRDKNDLWLPNRIYLRQIPE